MKNMNYNQRTFLVHVVFCPLRHRKEFYNAFYNALFHRKLQNYYIIIYTLILKIRINFYYVAKSVNAIKLSN